MQKADQYAVVRVKNRAATERARHAGSKSTVWDPESAVTEMYFQKLQIDPLFGNFVGTMSYRSSFQGLTKNVFSENSP